MADSKTSKGSFGPWTLYGWPRSLEPNSSGPNPPQQPGAPITNGSPMVLEDEPMENNDKAIVESLRVPKLLTPATAITYLSDFLTPYEQREILSYREIYCVGSSATKPPLPPDDPKWKFLNTVTGRYIFLVGNHMKYRFEVLKILGQGTSAEVIKAYDHKHKRTVAVKVFKDRKGFRAMAKKEAAVLKTFRNSKNVLQLFGHFKFRSHRMLVVEELGKNLNEFMLTSKPFTLAEVKTMTRSIFTGLLCLYEKKIVHCDIKPENVVFCRTGSLDLKFVDFGSAFSEDFPTDKDYVQTRWYRSPEVLLGQTDLFGSPIDWWSSAVLVAELFTGDALFKGEDEEDQMAFIIEVLDVPKPREMSEFKDNENTRTILRKYFHGNRAVYCGSERNIGQHDPQGKPGSRKLWMYFGQFKGISKKDAMTFSNFIRDCLQWLPRQRATPQESLDSEFLRQ